MELRVTLLEYDIRWLNPLENIKIIEQHLQNLTEKVDLLVLPEMFLTGFCMEAERSAVLENGAEVKRLLDMSQKYEVALLGSLAIVENDHFYNRVLLIEDGSIIGRYDKKRLYSPSGENAVFKSKYVTSLFEWKDWKILPQVCYDLRFPENIRSLPAPDLLIYVANWPTPRIHHWDALLKARAIENQCYTIGCNRIGDDGNAWNYPGHSQVVNFDGSVMQTYSNQGSQVVTLSKSESDAYRNKYRFLEDKDR